MGRDVVSGHEIHHLVEQYGGLVVFAAAALQALGAPLPGTTVLVAAALYAATAHGLPIAWVIAAGALGALAGTSAGFAVGRLAGESVLRWAAARVRHGPERVERLRAEFAEHGGPWLFVGRFVTGLRNVTGLLAGASGMPLRRFLALSAAAALLWALVNGLEYYWFGRALLAASTWVQVLLVAAGLLWMVISLRLLRRRAMRRLRRVG